MDSTVNTNILNRIFINLDSFRIKLINADDLIANLSGNISALEKIDSNFIDQFQNFIGEVEFIQSTEDSNLCYELIKKEVNNYENYLRQYFLINNPFINTYDE